MDQPRSQGPSSLGTRLKNGWFSKSSNNCFCQSRNKKNKLCLIRTILKFITYGRIPIFRTPGFSNQGTFPLVLPQSNSVILPPIFRPSIFESLDISNQFLLPWMKFSFHLNGHTLGFCSQIQNLELPSITQKTVPKKVHPSAFHVIWGLLLTSKGQFYYYHSLFKVYIEKENIADR